MGPKKGNPPKASTSNGEASTSTGEEGSPLDRLREIIFLSTSAEAQLEVDTCLVSTDPRVIIRSHLNSIANLAVNLIDQLAYTRGVLVQEAVINKIHEKLDNISTQPVQPTSITYAQAVRTAPQLPVQGIKLPKTPVPRTAKIKITPKPENNKVSTSEDTKNIFQKAVQPREMHVKIDRIIKIKNKAIIVEVPLGQENALISSKSMKKSGLVATHQQKLLPQMAIYGVPINFSKDLVEMLIAQNLNPDSDINTKNLNPLFKFGRRNKNTVHWVIEVNPTFRKFFIAQSRVYLDYGSCLIKDYTRVSRCYKCQEYGHIARDCNHSEACGICASERHATDQCPEPNTESPKCIIVNVLNLKRTPIKLPLTSARFIIRSLRIL